MCAKTPIPLCVKFSRITREIHARPSKEIPGSAGVPPASLSISLKWDERPREPPLLPTNAETQRPLSSAEE